MTTKKGIQTSAYLDQFHDDLRIFQEAFLLERLLGIRELSEEKIKTRMRVLELQLPGPYYCAVIFAPYLMKKEAEDIDLLLMQIVHRVQLGFRSYGFDCYTVSDSYCNAVAVLSLPSSESYLRVDEITRAITAEISKQHRLRLYVGLGALAERFVDISRSANTAAAALSFKYTFAQGNVIRAGDVESFYNQGAHSLKLYYDQILGCFYDGNLIQMSKRLQDLHEAVKANRKSELDSMRNECVALTAAILRQANEIGVEYPADGIYSHIMQTPAVNELIRDLLTLSGELLNRIRELNSSKSLYLVRQAESYIDERLCDKDLTLQDICDHVHLSQAYFSSIFFRETGQHLREYINVKRIERAKLLLLTTNDKVVSISKSLSFSSPSYFNNLFKKYTGVTPKAFREEAVTKGSFRKE